MEKENLTSSAQVEDQIQELEQHLKVEQTMGQSLK
jgi:hypothetical protein